MSQGKSKGKHTVVTGLYMVWVSQHILNTDSASQHFVNVGKDYFRHFPNRGSDPTDANGYMHNVKT
jgi:hypothetical protein